MAFNMAATVIRANLIDYKRVWRVGYSYMITILPGLSTVLWSPVNDWIRGHQSERPEPDSTSSAEPWTSCQEKEMRSDLQCQPKHKLNTEQ